MLSSVAFALTSLVAGETCPAALDVEQRVRAILHLSAEQELSEGFIVERREAGLFVELRTSDATVIGQRTLPSAGNCDELAQAAAVVLSTWLTDVHPDFAGALPEPVPLEPEPDPVRPVPPPLPPVRVAAPVVPSPPPAAARRRLELGLGVGGQLAAEKLSLAGFASLAYLPEQWGWGAGAFLTVDSARRQTLGEEGSVVWRRWPLGLGPSFRLGNASVVADLTVGPALAWLHLRGVDFSPNRARNGVTWAGFMQLHVATRGKASIFASGVAAYYATSTAYAADAERDLARLSITLCVGANLSL